VTDLRHDPVSGRLVIIAARRAARPRTLVALDSDRDRAPAQCPFCPGNEDQTPPEISRTGAGRPGEPNWRSRVFPNLYPITEAHEVVVLSPDHDRSFAQLSDEQAVEVMQILRDRVGALVDASHPYAIAFLNHGRAAGASIAHPHAQVIALDFVPPEVDATGRRQEAASGDLVDQDVGCARASNLVVDDGDAPTWCPHASVSPFQIRIAHHAAGVRFDQASDDVTAIVARATRRALGRLGDVLEDPPYNLLVHTAARESSVWPRWHVEVTPRISIPAGFEQATGVWVNAAPPESAASDLRSE
jgi:UDPglucose--hexose-1-phosphate uridylyltransferase